MRRVAHNRIVDGDRLTDWQTAVVPVPARGRVRISQAAGPVSAADENWRQAVETMTEWCLTGQRSLWLVEGGAGAGKTALLAEVARQVATRRWSCGWARPGFAASAVVSTAGVGVPSLVLVDDAETRADLYDVLCALARHDQTTPIRVIVAARSFGDWWSALLDHVPADARARLGAGRTIMRDGAVPAASPKDLVLRDESPGGAHAAAIRTLASADPATATVLLRLAAVVVALSTRVGQLDPAELRSAVAGLFSEEEGFWQRAAAEVRVDGQGSPALRSALAATAMLGDDGLADAGTVLRQVPALAAGAAGRLAQLAVWWHSLYLTSNESMSATPRLPGWLADRLPDGASTGAVTWTVAALAAERRTTATLAQLTIDTHRELSAIRALTSDRDRRIEDLRRSVSAIAPVDEALAWLTQELDLGDAEVTALTESISYPTASLGRTAIVLGRRRLEQAHVADQRADLALRLGARYSDMEKWDQALALTNYAVEIFHSLVGEDRGRYLADLATAVANLGACHAQVGQHAEAAAVMYEAVALHRELINIDRERYLGALARCLTNLCACVSKSGDRAAALSAAGQAVEIYRELVSVDPHKYDAELAAAEHNWRVCRRDFGQPVVGGAPVVGGPSVVGGSSAVGGAVAAGQPAPAG